MSDTSHALDTIASLSEGSLYQMVRALADHGENYGCNIYYHPNARPTAETIRLDGPVAMEWFNAFRAARSLYQARTGKKWSY